MKDLFGSNTDQITCLCGSPQKSTSFVTSHSRGLSKYFRLVFVYMDAHWVTEQYFFKYFSIYYQMLLDAPNELFLSKYQFLI